MWRYYYDRYGDREKAEEQMAFALGHDVSRDRAGIGRF